MTEQELHEKLTDILQMKLQELPLKPLGIIYKEAAEYLAVALSSAGIGDVRQSKFESDHFWRMWQGALVELERAKHREEVLKKAFKKYLEKEACRFCNYKKINYCESIKESQEDCFNATVETYIKQAEKELQEERKDD